MNAANYITINKTNSVSTDVDKTEAAFRVANRLKQDKIKGKLILHFDGSGKVAKVEVVQDL